jgi:transketolase
MRQKLASTLLTELENNKNLYVITGDTGFKVFDVLQEKFPENYLNSGLSEGAMTGMAAGMALQGKTVFTYGIAPFVTLRCIEQIKLDICYQNLPVIITGVGRGVVYGASGPTHHAFTDISCTASMPGITVICPADPLETAHAVRELIENPSPTYLRLGKTGEPVLHSKHSEFRIGKALCLSKPHDMEIAIAATGNMVEKALKVKDILSVRGLAPAVYDFHTIKPVDTQCLQEISQKASLVVTMEEHNVFNGFGAIIASEMSGFEKRPVILKFGLPDSFPEKCGSHEWMLEKAGLDPFTMAMQIEKRFFEISQK